MTDTGEASPSTYVSPFHKTISSLPKPTSDLLRSYAHIPTEEQAEHVTKIRDEAYARFPYPCIGNFRFLDLDLASHHAYQEHVLSPLSRPAVDHDPEPLFLDLGTCFGQDIRKLIHDGALVQRVWGSDIEPALIDLGFDMFRDADRFSRDRFLCPGDLLTNSLEDRLRVFNDRVTILHMTAVFHLFNLEDQRVVADRCLRLLRKDTSSPMLVLGGQAGSAKAGHYLRQNLTSECSHKYRHNEQSWEQLWKEVCGRDEWRGKIKTMEVKSKLLTRVRGDSDNPSTSVSYKEPGADSGEMLWHMFEVWVTFT
ncbi:Uu.00g007760.m01.CDS01 [Anthostomella pinea]|uniref:Uu.00g007760.m01.CDS01 n=1 Tax=Anthostomella pinea TaxID=933095 RepID=A0AAI8VX25_9PEZI|nr:Uu.00g007760.m01.CDS01 [Anthostomella pinea]